MPQCGALGLDTEYADAEPKLWLKWDLAFPGHEGNRKSDEIWLWDLAMGCDLPSESSLLRGICVCGGDPRALGQEERGRGAHLAGEES